MTGMLNFVMVLWVPGVLLVGFYLVVAFFLLLESSADLSPSPLTIQSVVEHVHLHSPCLCWALFLPSL